MPVTAAPRSSAALRPRARRRNPGLDFLDLLRRDSPFAKYLHDQGALQGKERNAVPPGSRFQLSGPLRVRLAATFRLV